MCLLVPYPTITIGASVVAILGGVEWFTSRLSGTSQNNGIRRSVYDEDKNLAGRDGDFDGASR